MLRKGCFNKISADDLILGFKFKQAFKKDLAYELIAYGYWGTSEAYSKILRIVEGLFPNSDHVGLPVSISIVRHPKLQMSALSVWPVLLTTSGAIQYGDPLSDLHKSVNLIKFESLLNYYKHLEAPRSLILA